MYHCAVEGIACVWACPEQGQWILYQTLTRSIARDCWRRVSECVRIPPFYVKRSECRRSAFTCLKGRAIGCSADFLEGSSHSLSIAGAIPGVWEKYANGNLGNMMGSRLLANIGPT